MSRRDTHGWPALATVVVLSLAATVAQAQAPAVAATPPDTSQASVEVVLEGALAMPAADLAASFGHTARGFSAGSGYALGLRVRWSAGSAIVISPAFHFATFAEHEDYDAAGERFRIATSVVRYGLDVLYQAPGSFYHWRPFVGLGVELAQNRYQETFDVDGSTYDATKNAFGPRVHAGVRRGDFDFSLSLSWSRFSTPGFFFTGDSTRYSWDAAQITVGYVLPRF
jgi:opacity protein-like surface antigen